MQCFKKSMAATQNHVELPKTVRRTESENPFCWCRAWGRQVIKGLDLQKVGQPPLPSLQTPVSVTKAVKSLVSLEEKELGFTCLSLS